MQERDPREESNSDDSGAGPVSTTAAPRWWKYKPNYPRNRHEYEAAKKLAGTVWKYVCESWWEFWKIPIDRKIELAFTLAIVLFALAQWKSSQTTTAQTDQLISASKISAYAATQNMQASRNFADSARSISDGVSDAVDKLNLQAGELAESATQTERLAGSTETATHHSLQADRAWIGMQNLRLEQFDLYKTLKIHFDLINSGKTPALHVRYAVSDVNAFNIFSYMWDQGRIKKTISDTAKKTKWDFKDAPIMAPQAVVSVPFESTEVLQDQVFLAVSGMQGNFFILGRVEYVDVSDRPEWENFCFQIYRENSALLIHPTYAWKYCPAGNDMSYQQEK